MADLADETRFRSFAERYVIERASTFRVEGNEELEDAWNAVARAKTIYNHIREKSLRVMPDEAPFDAPDETTHAAARRVANELNLAQNARITATVMQRAKSTTRIKPRSTP